MNQHSKKKNKIERFALHKAYYNSKKKQQQQQTKLTKIIHNYGYAYLKLFCQPLQKNLI